MLLVARLTDCPAASVYGPVTTADDRNTAQQFGTSMVFASNVTAPFRANARPSSVAPVCSVIDVNARMFPFKTELVPSVAELPTCQTMFVGWAPPLRITCRPAVVVRVEAIWKMKTALVSPWASSVRSPEEISSEEVDL